MQHYVDVDPRVEWKRGCIGWFLRVRGIATSLLAKMMLAGLAFWLAHWAIGVLIIGTGSMGVAGLVLYRHYRLKEMETDRRLHSFMHRCRDHVANMLEAPDLSATRERLDRFQKHVVDAVADFFRERLGDKTINCGLRTAQELDGKQMYVTRARSDGLDASRESNTEPIPSDAGLARALMEKDKQGVFIIPDLQSAIASGAWLKTKNDALPDMQTIMACPVNGFAPGEKKVMFGILYVTSKMDVFRPGHTLPLKAIADFLGLVYSVLDDKLAREPAGCR